MDPFSGVQALVDPSLTAEHHDWHSSHPPQVKQYLQDTSYPYYPGHLPCGPHGFWPQDHDHTPMIMHPRQESPSSQQPSYSSGESHSPPTETDLVPSTPPDTALMGPYHHYQGYPEAWTMSQSHIVAHMGGLDVRETPFVNPVDINPTQVSFEEGFVLSRSPSLVADSKQEIIGHRSCDASEIDDSESRKIEGRVQSPITPSQSLYPEPDNEMLDPSDVEPQPSKHEDDDGEWTPKTRTRKRSRSGSSGSTYSGNNVRRQRKRVKTSADAAPMSISSKSGPKNVSHTLVCPTCHVTSADEAALQKHNKTKHIRPFTCVFHFAGCPSSFPSKNEWKRHVMTQHLALNYWLCTQGTCAQCANPAPQPRHMALKSAKSEDSGAPRLPNGAIFNRKDLYTQHVRRMHANSTTVKSARQLKSSPDSEARIRQLQAEAEHTRCELPRRMTCPVGECDEEFSGSTAWDDRMEHVAKHLEKASEGIEPSVCFGGDADPSLTEWAEKPDVGVIRRTGHGRWELVNMLRGVIGPSNGNGKGVKGVAILAKRQEEADENNEEEVDADGEED